MSVDNYLIFNVFFITNVEDKLLYSTVTTMLGSYCLEFNHCFSVII